jgi:hypothetical protein
MSEIEGEADESIGSIRRAPDRRSGRKEMPARARCCDFIRGINSQEMTAEKTTFSPIG